MNPQQQKCSEQKNVIYQHGDRMTREKRTKLFKITIIGLVAAFLLNNIVKHVTHKTQTPPAPPVVIQKPISMKITNYVTQTGTVVAYNSVNLVARIEGYLEKVEFTDGTFVKKGQELFLIEPLPYMEKWKEAQAIVAAQRASYNYTKSEFARQQRMYKQNATSLNNVEKWSAQTDVVKAEIDKAVANAAVAGINYGYTHILAPFDGRIGRHLVDPGNYVGNGKATNLATIEQLDPIYVYFNLNELDLIKVREIARSHAFNPKNIADIPVDVKMQNESDFIHKGKLNFVNTGLNASTGTMEFRALLSNKDHALLPGFFVQVRVPTSNPAEQLTVPDTAIQYDQIGAYILTADKNNVVIVKRVVTGALKDEARAIIKGLTAKDNVIISGIQNAIPGNHVTPVQPGTKA